MTQKENKKEDKNIKNNKTEVKKDSLKDEAIQAGAKQEAEKKKKGEKSKKEKDVKSKKTEKKKLKKVDFEEKYNTLNDKYLRLTAEFDNYRKRTLKERIEFMKNAGEDILINFLPVMDNIDRAVNSVNEAKDLDAVKEGISLIHKNLFDFLKERGIKEIESIGEVFDTDLHEAITKIPAPEEDLKGKVVDVIEKGYKLKEKVLRYAKVVVGE